MEYRIFRKEIICDICGKEITRESHFKFKEHYASFSMGIFESYWGWYKRDMCNSCMKKIKDFVRKESNV